MGAAASLIGDHSHVATGTTEYLTDAVPFIWSSPIWFPLLVAVATVSLAETRLRMRAPRTTVTVRQGLAGVAAVIGIYVITALEHTAFRQDTNPLYRGRSRLFEPIQVLDDPVLRHLVEYDVRVAESLRPIGDWEVGLHQVRIVARGGDAGLPTPEGRHRDGHLFVGMHMLARRDCIGGESIVELADGTVERFTLEQPLDSVIVEDAAVWHEVTPIRAAPGAAEGIRDMLLVDLNPYGG